ncbi:MAG: D-2-hydroxyacid dehydrogenase [Aristaeellaceae bacterium]
MMILVVMPVLAHQREMLCAAATGEDFVFCPMEEVTPDLVQRADVIIGNAPADMIRGTAKLKWLQLNSAGTERYITPGVLPEDALLTNATGAYGLSISEHMLGCLLMLMKKLHLYHLDQQEQLWRDHGPVTSIFGSRTLVVGLGDIGGEFAQRMHALGSTVTGIRRHRTAVPAYLDSLHSMDDLMDCLKNADIVASCLPGTKDTLHIFRRETFAAMKPGAFFLNVGRGNAVDSDALAEALNAGHLAGAAVDVTDPEPLPAGHPLWQARNVLITPHVSGGYHLPETRERIIRIAAENLRHFLAGEPLKNVVDFSTGYRKL